MKGQLLTGALYTLLSAAVCAAALVRLHALN